MEASQRLEGDYDSIQCIRQLERAHSTSRFIRGRVRPRVHLRGRRGGDGGSAALVCADPPPQLPHVIPHHEELVAAACVIGEHLQAVSSHNMISNLIARRIGRLVRVLEQKSAGLASSLGPARCKAKP